MPRYRISRPDQSDETGSEGAPPPLPPSGDPPFGYTPRPPRPPASMAQNVAALVVTLLIVYAIYFWFGVRIAV
ncbi:MAG: hypothetical protein ACHRHE_23850, partial [Tepidisphaerales bacterium]